MVYVLCPSPSPCLQRPGARVRYQFPIAAVTTTDVVVYDTVNLLSYISMGRKADMGVTGLKSRSWSSRGPFGRL